MTLPPVRALLEGLAVVLDIPDEVYEDAVAVYGDLGAWLEKEDTALGRRPPEIYPQGSFRLGTMIRPATDADEYDIDLVYRRDIQKESTTQAQLKVEAGEHLQRYVEQKRSGSPALREGRRCWTLSYPANFHMDTLPAIPDTDGPREGLLITDRGFRLWQHSNPIGYAEWFKGRMQQRFLAERATLATSLREAVEAVPEWRVKTPLQRAVQLLKRHRDLCFKGDAENKPASIIITTLAGHAYENEVDILAAFDALVRKMPAFVERRDGVYWVPNPVHRAENFADRWQEIPRRAERFFEWLERLRMDVGHLVQGRTEEAEKVLKEAFGETALYESIERARAAAGNDRVLRESVPALADARHCLAPRWQVCLQAKVPVGATVYPVKEGKISWPLSQRPVPKNLHLRFEARPDVAPPYTVHWQVVNTGREAQEEGGLRGDFYDGQGPQGTTRWEQTRYRGRHWVEAFVVKGDVCVARSGRIAVNIP